MYILNRNRSKPLAGIELGKAGASAEDKQSAIDLLRNGEVLIAAGKNRWVKDSAGYSLSFVADQFYLPIQPADLCDDGYEYQDGRCLTPHGCEAPLIELKTFGGVPNPETGEANISYGCTEHCVPPVMNYVAPARCEVYMP